MPPVNINYKNDRTEYNVPRTQEHAKNIRNLANNASNMGIPSTAIDARSIQAE
jgi:hypothetical protein